MYVTYMQSVYPAVGCIRFVVDEDGRKLHVFPGIWLLYHLLKFAGEASQWC